MTNPSCCLIDRDETYMTVQIIAAGNSNQGIVNIIPLPWTINFWVFLDHFDSLKFSGEKCLNWLHCIS